VRTFVATPVVNRRASASSFSFFFFSIPAAVVGNAELGRHAEHLQIPLTQKAPAATATEGTETFAEADKRERERASNAERERGRERGRDRRAC